MNWYNDIAVGVTRHISSFWASHTLQLLANLMNPRNTLKAFILEFKIFPHICLFYFCLFYFTPVTTSKGIVKPTATRFSTSISALPAADEVSADLAADMEYMKRWGEIKVLSRADAESTLQGAELEAYNNYHQHITDDVARMSEIANMIVKSLEKKKEMKPKTKGQRKRDKWAKVQAREAARAAAK